MRYIKNGPKYIVRLEKDEEILSVLTKFCRVEQINFGTISAIGGATHVTLGWYELSSKSYHWKDFFGDLEITSLIGNIAQLDGKPFLHIHTVISNESFQCFGGHLKQAVVSATCEMIIEKMESQVNRKLDDEIGLNLLDLTPEDGKR